MVIGLLQGYSNYHFQNNFRRTFICSENRTKLCTTFRHLIDFLYPLIATNTLLAPLTQQDTYYSKISVFFFVIRFQITVIVEKRYHYAQKSSM